MRKLTLKPVLPASIFAKSISLLLFAIFFTIPWILNSQCTPSNGTIGGMVYLEEDFNGQMDPGETGMGNVMISVYDASGQKVGEDIANPDGTYSISGLTNGQYYRVEFDAPEGFFPSVTGGTSKEMTQFVQVPVCDASLGLQIPADYCEENPRIGLSCFARGGYGENDLMETLVALEHDFDLNSEVSKFAMKGQTGSVWGVAWSKGSQTLYSSAFVKQYASLSSHGLGAIFQSKVSRTRDITNSLFVNVSSLGIDVGTLGVTDPNDCNYGAQVFKKGLGALVISPDEEYLYVVNINNNSVVRISRDNPYDGNHQEYFIDFVGCEDNEFRAFAMVEHEGSYYVGITCTAETSKNREMSAGHVLRFDPDTGIFESIFSTNYLKGYWADQPANRLNTSHVLTDIAFTDEGNMILGISDRVGHRFCNETTGRTDQQFADILLVWNDNGTWRLEDNGQAGILTGVGVDNLQGPGGGEFFGDDYWVTNPILHPEVALGSVYTFPGKNQVVATVYDPVDEAYSGGLHRYSTQDGHITSRIELYERDFTQFFGKATGFGDIIAMCGDIPIEIGNRVWIDSNNNGQQDAGESGFAGLELSLYDDNCQLVAQTLTDQHGQYYFNDSNVDLNQDGVYDGLEYESDYYVVITDSRFDKNNASLNANGESYVLGIPNKAGGNNGDRLDSDAKLALDICQAINGAAYIAVKTGSSGENDHTIDIGITTDLVFDLALIKRTSKETSVRIGEVVPFEIMILNQGNLVATDIVVDDHLNLAYEFEEGMNPGWKLNGSFAKYKITEPLYPGEMTSVFINLIISENATKIGLMNIAEIGSANDQFGNPGVDIDSTPDDDPNNDMEFQQAPPGNDSFDDVGFADEDDHDFEDLNVFDLALIKIIDGDDNRFIAGEEVPYLIRIYNQGNEIARDIDIVDYFPKGFEFNASKNPGWTQDSDETLIYSYPGPLNPGDIAEIELKMDIAGNFAGTRLVNYAEIVSASSDREVFPNDLDSEANRILGDDAGGEPGTPYDNEIFLRVEDEDDHDGEQVYVDRFDLALLKTADVNLANAGDLVTFTIYVFNQGGLAADNIKVVDYLPDNLLLADPDWQVDPTDPAGERLCYTLSSQTGTLGLLGLLPGDVVGIPITLEVAGSAPVGPITNEAEIVSATDVTGLDITDLDDDSTFDTIDDNDNVIDDEILDDGSSDEDDHDPETIYITDTNIDAFCICLDNATNAEDGQFEDQISILAPSGQNWFIADEHGVYNPVLSMDPPIAPLPYMTGPGGYLLPENMMGGGMSTYSLGILHIDGQGYNIILENEDGDQEAFQNPGCQYDDPIIEGPRGVCDDSFAEYFALNTDPFANHVWDVSNGGMISQNFGTHIVVNWTDLGAIGTVSLVVDGLNTCYAPTSIEVGVGAVGGPISCLGYLQTSLDENCQLVVTPDMVLTGELNELAFYSVMLTDEYGNPVPNATLTDEHIGQTITVKVIDDCGGNSCWGTIEVEDKLAPVIDCSPIILNCWDMINYEGPEVVENCSSPVEITMIDENFTSFNCDDEFIKEYNRTYIATDIYGNVSNECIQTITLRRINFDLVVFPDSFLISEDRALTCGAYPVDEDGFPLVEATGVPTIEGLPLYPVSHLFCNIGVGYTDVDLPTTDCTRKILRTWTVYEGVCNSIPKQSVQLIEVEDNIPPQIFCPDDITVTSNGEVCGADVVLPPAQLADNCSTEFQVDISYDGGFLNNQNGGTVFFEAGVHEITYTVYDECHNSAYCSIQVTVKDETAPVAICDQNTVVGLSLTGEAVVYAYAFDDGSYDDCYIDRMEVARMSPLPFCDPVDILLGESVTFCCEDVGKDHLVVFRVYDQEDNYNECMVNVHVQDKHPPIIHCPDDVTISCNYLYDLEDLSEFGMATAQDQCIVMFDSLVTTNINSCGIGYIDREFRAFDMNGESVCTQRITITNFEPFNFDDITPPEDFETEAACDAGDLDPDALDPPFDRPMLTEDECDLVGMSYRDFVFPIEDEGNSCLKILRKWTIIDWCQPKDEGGFKTWEHSQIIKVINTQPPFIRLTVAPETCSFDEECVEGFVELEASATDDCTPGINLFWMVAFDQDNDGSIDSTWEGTGSLITADGYYPLGTHQIYFTFEDRCGNKTTDSAVFTIKNCKAPIAVCIDGLAIGIEPMDTDGDGVADTEMAIICAEDFDASSLHPCGFDIKFTFDQECELECIPVDCNDIGEQVIQIWVTDIFGNQAYCETTIVIQDTNDEDICEEVDDCIEWPEAEITVSDCVPDYDPLTINSETVIDPDCICDEYDIEFDDSFSEDADGCTVITRLWTVTFTCGLIKEFDYTQTINILNNMAPEITCPDDITVTATGGDCESDVDIPVPQVFAPCNSGYTITHNSVYADVPGENASGSYPVGATTVTFTAEDMCGNSSSCDVMITVNDGSPPVCIAQDITIQLDINGMASITADQINNGSFDDCGMITDIEVTPVDFTCDDIGMNTVTLTVTDDSGNISNCTATVTVEDTLAPECVAQDITIMLDDQGMATIMASQLDGGSVDTCGMTDVSFMVNQDSFDCDDVGDVDVVLTVSDEAGNTSTCEAVVTVVDEVNPVCVPQDITVALNDNGMVSIMGIDVDGGSFDLCGDITSLEVTPADFDCGNIGPNAVILTVTDESGNTSSCNATVTVEDPLAPECVPQDITVMLDENGMASITAADVDGGSNDACGDGGVTVTIDIMDFTCDDIGVVTVTLTVTDGNNNTSTCEAMVTVQDMVAPECVPQDITVYLDDMGMVSIMAEDVDGGSTDACGTISDFEVSQEDFDCDDIGDNMVDLTVTDDSDNTSSCEAIVTVLDTISPICVVTDITIFLDEQGMASIDPDSVGQGSSDNCDFDLDLVVEPGAFFCNDAGTRGFDLIVTDDSGNSSSCEGMVTILDTIPPEIICPVDLTIDCAEPLDDLSIYGEAMAMDECGLSAEVDEVSVINVDDCGLGTVVRTFTATDNSNNISQCSQIITITLGDDPVGLDDIIPPPDTVFIEDCTSIDPEDLPGTEPIVDESNADCSNIFIDYMDMSLTGGMACPDTILRVWTIIDSCQLEMGTQNGIFDFDQILVITDTNAPILDLPGDMTIFLPEDTCSIFVSLPGTVTDCDLDPTVVNDSPFADDNNSVDASGVYPDGIHTVTVTATDACGNMSTGSYTLTLLDTIPPMFECVKIVANIQDDGTIEVPVDSLISTLTDNCTDSLLMTVSFSVDDPFDTTRVYDCDFLMGNVTRDDTLFLYAFDNSLNYDSCKTIITVSDIEGNFCGGNRANVFGAVNTEFNESVSLVSIELEGSELDDEVTGDDGKYAFRNMPMGNSYTVIPEKDLDPLNGVSTLDIILIQKHILGIDPFDSPYKYIAGDINNSRSVTAADMLELRKLILGIYNDFPNNKSWRMVNSSFEFFDPQDPFADEIPESYFIPLLDKSIAIDFVGVKVGDLNGSADPVYFNDSEIEVRAKPVVLDFVIRNSIAGDRLRVDVYAEDFDEVEGMQFSLSFPEYALSFAGIESGKMNINASNLGTQFSEDGLLTLSWHNLAKVSVEDDEVLFSLLFEGSQEMIGISSWDLSSEITAAELYTKNGVKAVEGRFTSETLDGLGYALDQNAPNPWSENTSIKFTVPMETEVEMNVYDVTGKRIYQKEGIFSAGHHSINIDKEDLPARGLLYYELKTKDVNLIRKMLHIK